MLKKRELHECQALYTLMIDPAVFPYVRTKCQTFEEYLFMTKKLMAEEEQGNEMSISRTILDEMGHPIGTIDLYQITNRTGFLATWIGAPYFGLGYNQRAKDAFLTILFLEHAIETVYLKIRKHNLRSRKAVNKLPYAQLANDENDLVYLAINHAGPIYDMYRIDRSDFLANCSVLQQELAT